jgi:hypothetical protein
MDLVVPVAVELITFQTDPSELFVVCFGPSRVDASIDFGLDLQTLGWTSRCAIFILELLVLKGYRAGYRRCSNITSLFIRSGLSESARCKRSLSV